MPKTEDEIKRGLLAYGEAIRKRAEVGRRFTNDVNAYGKRFTRVVKFFEQAKAEVEDMNRKIDKIQRSTRVEEQKLDAMIDQDKKNDLLAIERTLAKSLKALEIGNAELAELTSAFARANRRLDRIEKALD